MRCIRCDYVPCFEQSRSGPDALIGFILASKCLNPGGTEGSSSAAILSVISWSPSLRVSWWFPGGLTGVSWSSLDGRYEVGGYKGGYKSRNMGYKYRYLAYT